MPTYRVQYQHLGSKGEVTIEVPTEAAAGSEQQLEGAIAQRLGERLLPHAELAIRHKDRLTVAEKLAKAYDLTINSYTRL
ncbi:MAG: hypothetical protein ACQEQZ_07120 [Pseudomonadota bacterium]